MIKDLAQALPRHNKLLRQITRLNIIAGTPETAFKFGPELKKLEVVIYSKNILAHGAGLKKFWKLNLPTLKFHNDDVDFVVTRVRPTKREDFDKIPLEVRLHQENGKMQKVDCTNKDNESILREVVEMMNAKLVAEKDIPTLYRYEHQKPVAEAEAEAL
ncbi:hypothetical protein PUMCH_002819 [Australozyma saopauloensis]|uniref:Ribosomal protein/NADH dehydrogenase domain-containing protein n=1 Tax=Australozyma saopauloensis TaxID=291208 RepID=A0AAX4HAC4_9ASCO|nr:hypothetical protein PUMCH_002819 [[Candida] saopauloensis]